MDPLTQALLSLLKSTGLPVESLVVALQKAIDALKSQDTLDPKILVDMSANGPDYGTDAKTELLKKQSRPVLNALFKHWYPKGTPEGLDEVSLIIMICGASTFEWWKARQ